VDIDVMNAIQVGYSLQVYHYSNYQYGISRLIDLKIQPHQIQSRIDIHKVLNYCNLESVHPKADYVIEISLELQQTKFSGKFNLVMYYDVDKIKVNDKADLFPDIRDMS
jgi:hypothetical protein